MIQSSGEFMENSLANKKTNKTNALKYYKKYYNSFNLNSGTNLASEALQAQSLPKQTNLRGI